MKKFLTEFKEFALKGNVMDLAVGMMIGSAFGKIVSSLVNDILMPLIAGIFRLESFAALKILLVEKSTEDPSLNVYLNYGQFIQNIIDFLIIALCIFFLVKTINKLHKKPEEKPAEEPAPPEKSDELKALEEIVELLKNK
ncbi:MAG: large-conductance mechanosensitive channel protein MscL [Solobacterium sp.]|nr:large-conductance mechanosensitive channel protein MscL [Solobacterium sp.]